MKSAWSDVVATVGVAIGGVVCALVYSAISAKWSRWRKVGTVSNIYIHPVKSARALDVREAELLRHGIALKNGTTAIDRAFLITKPNGDIVTGREESQMVLIKADVQAGVLTLGADGANKIEINLPGSVCKAIKCRIFLRGSKAENHEPIDCGDAAADWLQNFLDAGIGYRLKYYPRISPSRQFGGHAQVLPIYNMTAPCCILSQKSLDHLNQRLGALDNVKQVSARNFRPSIVVAECHERSLWQRFWNIDNLPLREHDEDRWLRVRIGRAEMDWARLCARCLLTTVDPDEGTRDPDGEPLRTLREYRLAIDEEEREIYRNRPRFGVHYDVAKEGRITVGDDVYALVSDEPPPLPRHM